MSNNNSSLENKKITEQNFQNELKRPNIYIPNHIKLLSIDDIEIAFQIILKNVKEQDIPDIKNFVKDNFGNHFLFDKLDNEGVLYAYVYDSQKTRKDFFSIFNEEIKKDKRLVLKN